MKKIFSIATCLFVLSFVILTMPAFPSCSKDGDVIVTGAACSIAELNSLNKNNSLTVNSEAGVIKERNLRPVRIPQDSYAIENPGCIWGRCLIKEIFNK